MATVGNIVQKVPWEIRPLHVVHVCWWLVTVAEGFHCLTRTYQPIRIKAEVVQSEMAR